MNTNNSGNMQDAQQIEINKADAHEHSRHNGNQSNKPHDKLHIFINNIKYSEEDGVKQKMSGRELAALVPIQAEKADVTRKNSEVLIGPDEIVDLKMADHFEVIRKQVVAGCIW